MIVWQQRVSQCQSIIRPPTAFSFVRDNARDSMCLVDNDYTSCLRIYVSGVSIYRYFKIDIWPHVLSLEM